MTFRISHEPTVDRSDQPDDFVLLTRRVAVDHGIPGLEQVTKPEIVTKTLPAILYGLAHGDIPGEHLPYDERDAELYGPDSFGQGTVAKVISDAAISNGENPYTSIYDMQLRGARWVDARAKAMGWDLPTEGDVAVHPDRLVIYGEHVVPLTEPPQTVMVLAPGFGTGRGLVRNLLGFPKEGAKPFELTSVAQSHFTDRAIVSEFDRDPDHQMTAVKAVGTEQYIGRVDGISQGIKAILERRRAEEKPTEVVDVLLLTDPQHATRPEIRSVMSRAFWLMSPGGTLVLGGPERQDTDQVGIGSLEGLAVKYGFAGDRPAVRFHDEGRKIGAVVFTKPYPN